VPTFRPDIETIRRYRPGKPIDEVSRELGISDIVKLASNESPLPPFPEVQAAVAAAAADVHRYPEDSCHYLVADLADHLGVTPEHLWMGAGSSQLIMSAALTIGGPGTSAVFAQPSFVMYPISTALAGSEAIAVPLDGHARHDVDALIAAVRDDTTVLYVCNPNNPTGTSIGADAVRRLVDQVPSEVMVMVDEAYFEYVTDPEYGTALPLVDSHDNVVVLRTFSKVYGLAGLRVGYAVAQPHVIRHLRRGQPPFSVSSIAQEAARVALRHRDRLSERVAANTAGRDQIEAGLAVRDLEYVPSETNFVLFTPPGDPAAFADALLKRGVIVRPIGGRLRVSVGLTDENARFLAAVDELLRSPDHPEGAA
jgi:histidinol-phosphate aminotransferase